MNKKIKMKFAILLDICKIYPRHEKSPKLFNWKKHKRYSLNITVQEPLNPLNYDEQEMFKQLEKKLKGEDL